MSQPPSTPRKTVLVLGAHGRLGLAAAHAFADAGWQVLAQVRRTTAPDMPTGAIVLNTPLADTARLCAQAAGARVVVHAVNPPYTRWRQEAMPLLQDGIAVAERLGARLMLPGNVYNYGAGMPARLTEATPQVPTTEHGRTRVAMEEALRAASARGRLRATVVTAGDFFGAGSGSWFDLVIVKSLAAGKLAYPGPRNLPHAWAYLPDLARVFVRLADEDDPAPFTRLHFGGYSLTGDQLLDAIEQVARETGRAPAQAFMRGGMPWALLRVGGWVVPMWRALASMAYLWQVPHSLDDSALRERLGNVTSTPLPQALRASLSALTPAAQQGSATAATSAHGG